jgi:MoxR-like ATPase
VSEASLGGVMGAAHVGQTGQAGQAGQVGQVEQARQTFVAVRGEIAKAVVGQDAVVSGVVVALLADGHVLLEGVPGVAKTRLVRSLAAQLTHDTKRVQCTPDMIQGYFTGSDV